MSTLFRLFQAHHNMKMSRSNVRNGSKTVISGRCNLLSYSRHARAFALDEQCRGPDTKPRSWHAGLLRLRPFAVVVGEGEQVRQRLPVRVPVGRSACRPGRRLPAGDRDRR